MKDIDTARAVKEHLKAIHPGVTFGITRSGDSAAVAVRAVDPATVSGMPTQIDGVAIVVERSGPIRPLA